MRLFNRKKEKKDLPEVQRGYVIASHEAEQVLSEVEETLSITKQDYVDKTLDVERSVEDLEAKIHSHNETSQVNFATQKTTSQLVSEMRIIEFDKKFPQYKELKALIARYEMGIITPEQKQKISDIINMGRIYYPDFSLDDILLPYLEEKSHLKILSEEEKKMCYSKRGYDSFAAKELIAYISLNAIVFYRDDKQARDKFIKSFEWCHQKINLFYSQSDKEKLLQEAQKSVSSRR